MADHDTRATAPGNESDGAWSRSGTIYFYDCLAAESDDKVMIGNNYTGSGDDGRRFSGFSASGMPTYVVINSVTFYVNGSRSGTGAGTWKPYFDLSGANKTAGSNISMVSGWYSQAVSRPGGGSWARSDIANIGVYYSLNNDATQSRTFSLDGALLRVSWDYITLQSLTASAATNVTDTSATLPCSYNANGDGDTEWRIVYRASGGSYDDPSWTASSNTGSNSVSRNLSGLSGGTLYYYKLQARNSNDSVQESSGGSFTTTASTGGLILFF